MRKIVMGAGLALLMGLLMTGCMKKLTPREQAEQTTDEQKQLLLVHKQPDLIRYMSQPSEKVQYDAVLRDAKVIAYIDNPSERIQRMAIGKKTSYIRYIKHPTEKVQLLAVEWTKKNIRYIENPSEAVQIASLSNIDSGGFPYLKNPSERVQIEAVTRNWKIIGSIENPSEKVQLAAVTANPKALERIKNPTEAVKAAAIQTEQKQTSMRFTVKDDALRKLNPEMTLQEIQKYRLRDGELNYTYTRPKGECVRVPVSYQAFLKGSDHQVISVHRGSGQVMLSWMEEGKQYLGAYYPTLSQCQKGAAKYLSSQ